MVQDAAAIVNQKVSNLISASNSESLSLFGFIWKIIRYILKTIGLIGPFSQENQLVAMCQAISKMKEDKRFQEKYKVIYNSLDPDGSDLKF